jgi:hypothetical protein
MNLQEQISRIQSMMGIVNESKIIDAIQKMINNTVENIKKDSEDWGLGEMDELDEIGSVEKIEIDRFVNFTRPVIYVNIFVNSQRRDFDNVMSEINYQIQRYIPNSFVEVNEIIDTRTFGPGIDF